MSENSTINDILISLKLEGYTIINNSKILNMKIKDFIKSSECKEYSSIEVASKDNISITIVHFAKTKQFTFTEYTLSDSSSNPVTVSSYKDLCTIHLS